MRTRIIVVIALACLGTPALAADDKPSKQERGPRSHIQPVEEIVAQAAAPWAGLVTSRAPAVLREQLELEHGAGLIVEEVAIGSPAERAGLRQHDVLVALAGQLLVLPEQLTTLLEEWGDDEPLTCRVLRSGKPIEVTLRPRVAGSIAKSSVSGATSKPTETAESTVASATAQSPVLKPTASVLAMLPKKAAASAPTAIATQTTAAAAPKRTLLTSTVVQLEDGSLLQKDADYSIKLSAGTDAILVVKDARGRIVYNNRIATPEQRSFMPPDVLARVEGLERLQARRRAIAQPVVTEQPASQTRPERIGSLGIEPVTVR